MAARLKKAALSAENKQKNDLGEKGLKFYRKTVA